MPRKKRPQAEEAGTTPVVNETASGVATATEEPSAENTGDHPAWIDGPPTAVDGEPTIPTAQPKTWGDPYKPIFSSPEVGFELGENRRFKQRVFKFSERPSPEIIDELKDSGFTYRPAEKAWTIPANAETRKMTDEQARIWAGANYAQGIER